MTFQIPKKREKLQTLKRQNVFDKVVDVLRKFSAGASVDSSVVRIPAFQAGGPGSIPGRRTFTFFVFKNIFSI